MSILPYLPAALAGVAVLYQFAATDLLRRFIARKPPVEGGTAPVTVLRPLCGDEPCLLGNLLSVAGQDHPALQLVVGVRDPADPALAAVARLAELHPGLDLAVVADPTQHGSNRKVSNLINMAAKARHGALVISDSDVALPADMARRLAAELERPGVGIVTCLYVGRAGEGLWSRLMAMGINHAFVPSTLVARALGRDDGCFGPTMAIRRETLDRAGGFAALKDRLADDYDLGANVRALGLTIAVAPAMVEVAAHEPTLAALFRHELRWERTVAMLAPWGQAFSVVTQPLPFALLAAFVSPYGGWIAAAALLARLGAVRLQEKALGLPPAPPWLLLARDALGFAVYLAAALGRSVTWRGARFRVARDGTLSACMERRKA